MTARSSTLPLPSTTARHVTGKVRSRCERIYYKPQFIALCKIYRGNNKNKNQGVSQFRLHTCHLFHFFRLFWGHIFEVLILDPERREPVSKDMAVEVSFDLESSKYT